MTNAIDAHVGKRIRRRRRLLGLTQQNLAQAVGIRFQQIQKYESGTNRVSASRLYELAEALDVPVQYFYEGLASSGATPPPSGSDALAPDIMERPETLKLVAAYYKAEERPRLRILALLQALDPNTAQDEEDAS